MVKGYTSTLSEDNVETQPKLMLLGLKSDLEDDRDVKFEEGKQLAE